MGNPPWINWESLPESYREPAKPLWQYYGLENGSGKGMGWVKRDMAMLFVARTFDRYLKPGGRLAFLVPFTLFKTQAGAGFRRFLTYGRRGEPRIPVKLLRVHDLVTLYPFEGATTRTGLLVIEKAEKTEFPVPLVVWNWPDSRGADVEATLDEAKARAEVHRLVFIPIEEGKPESPWMMTSRKVEAILRKIMRPSEYSATAGVWTWADSIYWIEILAKTPTGLLISNVGRTMKGKSKRVKAVVEEELVFPLVRGRNSKKWFSQPEGSIILPADPETGDILPEDKFKITYPLAYEFFLKFENELRSRSGYKQLLKKNRSMLF